MQSEPVTQGRSDREDHPRRRPVRYLQALEAAHKGGKKGAKADRVEAEGDRNALRAAERRPAADRQHKSHDRLGAVAQHKGVDQTAEGVLRARAVGVGAVRVGFRPLPGRDRGTRVVTVPCLGVVDRKEPSPSRLAVAFLNQADQAPRLAAVENHRQEAQHRLGEQHPHRSRADLISGRRVYAGGIGFKNKRRNETQK